VSNDAAGEAYIYEKGKHTSVWPTTPAVALSDPDPTGYEYGYSVAESGTTAVIGGFDNTGPGAGFVYVKTGSVWPATPTFTLSDPGASVNDQFGSSVAVSGATAVIGAPGGDGNSGDAYMYKP
jgi:hypothetical protein